jgi:hypothetical protein
LTHSIRVTVADKVVAVVARVRAAAATLGVLAAIGLAAGCGGGIAAPDLFIVQPHR